MSEITIEKPRDAEAINASIARMKKLWESQTPEQRAAAERRRADIEDRHTWAKVQDILATAGLPRRHMEKRDLDRSGDWGKAQTALQVKLGTGFLIALIGERGPGKTQLAVELVRYFVAENERPALFCSATQFFMAVKASYKDGSADSEQAVMAKFTAPGLLVIDEIGQRSDTEWENRLLYELLNQRYNAVKDTLLISNQDQAVLEAALGSSIISRMRETGGIVECNWKSYRA